MLSHYFFILSGFVWVIYGQGFFRGRLPDCRRIRCGPPPGCAVEHTFTPLGHCCPVCRRSWRPRCYGVVCPRLRCVYSLYTPPGRCCPECRRPPGPGLDKPGICPRIGSSFGICVSECTWDSECSGMNKCCSNGCGQVCTRPVYGGIPGGADCSAVSCLLPRCRRPFTPLGQCCPVCPRRGGVLYD